MSKRRLLLQWQYRQGLFTRRIVGPHALGIVYETPFGTFAVDPEDNKVGKELRDDGAYATDEVERLTDQLTEEMNVLVVGAHVGTLVIPIARKARRVVAIEANPRTYKLLALNVGMNRAENVTTHQMAASDSDAAIEFVLSTANSGGSKRAPKTDHYMYDYDRPDRVTVPACRLDDLVAKHHPGMVFNVIVMDIEGSEYFALKGMSAILEGTSMLQIEFIPHHLSNVAGVSVQEFVEPLRHHFTSMHVPSRNITVGKEEMESTLQYMADHHMEDYGVIFTK